MASDAGSVQVFWSTTEWARAIVELPVEGPLPVRTVLVPRQRVAHALRRELIRLGRADVLAGTRLLPLYVAAVEVLQAAGVSFTGREEQLRPLRLRVLFQQRLSLGSFRAEELRETPGWDDAFARAIDDLEAAGVRPDEVADVVELADVVLLWRKLDEWAPSSWTTGRVFTEAARVLRRSPSFWRADGPVLAGLSGDAATAQARFVAAIPRARAGLVAARPLRGHYLERLEMLFGRRARERVASPGPQRRSSSEREILASYLFEAPDRLADAGRRRSAGPDGTVSLEQHAGLEDEIEAAVDWVARQALEAGTALEDMALLVPVLDPVAGLLVERLRRLPWPGGEIPVVVAGGLPLVGTAAGARVLAVLRALRDGLSAERVGEVLPCLRAGGDEARHLSLGAAKDLAYSLGTAGGSATDLSGALQWAARAARRAEDLERLVAATEAVEDEEEKAGAARRGAEWRRLRDDLRAFRPALEGLVEVARAVLRDAPLAVLWTTLRDFLERWLLAPGEGAPPWALLAEGLEPVCADERFAALSGAAALGVVEQTLRGLRVPVGRFGDPAVYVGTIRDAANLPFAAVRVLGLAEGSVPPSSPDNPVLPESLRRRVAGGAIVTAADRALAELHALDRVVRDTGRTLALSAPRLGVERSDREPSSVFIEAAAALGRPNRIDRTRDRLVPNATALQRDAFGPAQREWMDFRVGTPVGAAAWLDRVARLGGVPATWRGHGELDLDRLRDLAGAPAEVPIEGFVAADGPLWHPTGLVPERPISASALRLLLECPHRYLFERVLSWREPAAPPSRRTIDPLPYGALFHRVAELFYRRHGAAFGARERTLEDWQGVGDELAGRQLDLFCNEYPLVGPTVREQQRQRLQRDLGLFLEYDWDHGRPRPFVAVERPFGIEVPVQIEAGGVVLHLRGYIDRIDVEAGGVLVRDLKTGKAKLRVGDLADPDPALDLQIAVYGMVARRLAAEWGLSGAIAAAYAYTDSSGEAERSFREDFGALEAVASRWLTIAAHLLDERSFPRTPDDEDCTFCPFQPVCGPEARPRSAALLGRSTGTPAAFRDLKLGGSE